MKACCLSLVVLSGHASCDMDRSKVPQFDRGIIAEAFNVARLY